MDFAALRPAAPVSLDYDAYADPYQPPDYGPGWEERINFADVTGTADIVRFTPGDSWEMPVSLWQKLVTSAVAGNRVLFLELMTDQGQVLARADTTQLQAASLTGFWLYDQGLNVFGTSNNGTRLAPMPQIILFPGYQIRLRIASGDAGDVRSQIGLVMRRWRNRPRRLAQLHPAAAPL